MVDIQPESVKPRPIVNIGKEQFIVPEAYRGNLQYDQTMCEPMWLWVFLAENNKITIFQPWAMQTANAQPINPAKVTWCCERAHGSRKLLAGRGRHVSFITNIATSPRISLLSDFVHPTPLVNTKKHPVLR